MSEAQTLSKSAAPRSEGGQNRAGAGAETAARSEVLSADSVREIGEVLGGRVHWKADVARRIDYDKTAIGHAVADRRPVTSTMARKLQSLMVEQIEDLARLLTTSGLPFSAHPVTQETRKNLINLCVEAARLADQDLTPVGTLSAAKLEEIGVLIGGRPHWQGSLAEALGYSKSGITKYLSEARQTTPLLANGIRRQMIKKLSDLADRLVTPGLPGASDPAMQAVVAKMRSITVALSALSR